MNKENELKQVLKNLTDLSLEIESGLAAAMLGQDHFEIHPQLKGTLKKHFEEFSKAGTAARKVLNGK